MKKVRGTILEREGKFFVQVGKQIQELTANPLADDGALKGLVGQVVQVVMTEPQIVAILPRWKPPVACFSACFICYMPPPLFWQWQINPVIREMNLKLFKEQGLISQEVYDQQINML